MTLIPGVKPADFIPILKRRCNRNRKMCWGGRVKIIGEEKHCSYFIKISIDDVKGLTSL